MNSRQFRVMWKHPKMRVMNGTFSAQNVQSLLRLLDRIEGINAEDCDMLYVHETQEDGGILEIVAVDNRKKDGLKKIEMPGKSNVTELRPRVPAPYTDKDNEVEVIASVKAAIEKIKNRRESHPAVDHDKLPSHPVAGRWRVWQAPVYKAQ